MSEDRHPAATGALAAWALDACSPGEAAVISAHLESCCPCSREAGRLRDTAGLLAAAVAAPPPPGLRDTVLAAARTRRPPGTLAVPGEGLAWAYAEQVAGLHRLLGSLTAAHWRTPLPRYASVRDLVVHLTANDASFASDLGLPLVPGPGFGAREAWHAQARTVMRGVQDVRLLERPASLAGAARVRASGRSALVQRTFETWTHADDIRAAVGRPAEPPRGEHLRLIAELGVGLLPGALRALGLHHPGRTARLTLTGPGGGEWLVPLAPGHGPGDAFSERRGSNGHPDAAVTAAAEDFCRLLADRVAPAPFPHRADGDPAIVADLLRAAATLGCD